MSKAHQDVVDIVCRIQELEDRLHAYAIQGVEKHGIDFVGAVYQRVSELKTVASKLEALFQLE